MHDRFGKKSDALWIVRGCCLAWTAVVSGDHGNRHLSDPRKQTLAVGRKAYVVTWYLRDNMMTLVHCEGVCLWHV